MLKKFIYSHVRNLNQLSCGDRLARIRAYNKLRFNQGEKPIFDFINDLVARTFILPDNFFKGIVAAGYEREAVISFRQKLLRITLDYDLSPAVMMAMAGSSRSLRVRLPQSWREDLSAQGLQISKLSSFLWFIVVLGKLKEAIDFYRLTKNFKNLPKEKNGYALLLGLPTCAYCGLSINDDQKQYNNFANWFHARHPELCLHIVNGKEQVGGLKSHAKYRENMWPSLIGNKPYKEFRYKAGLIILRSLLSLLKGNWIHAFMARDLLELEYMQKIDESSLPELVALTNSHYIFRPLWSYYLEQKGVETGIYFYSTNTFNIALNSGEYGLIYGYKTMSWSHYYTATPEQANFIDSVTMYPKQISVVGPIPLEDNGAQLPEKRAPVLAYFDVQPFRDAFMSAIGRPVPLYYYEASRRNLEDVILACKKHGFTLALKPKRDVGNRLCQKYKKMIDSLVETGEIILIESHIAAERVADWADVIVSQPFTSVAVVAHNLGKPSVYYDAMQMYKKIQPAAQGLSLLQSYEQLSSWLEDDATGRIALSSKRQEG